MATVNVPNVNQERLCPLTSQSHTLLCLDFGTQKMGMAVGQTITSTASPLPVIKAKQGEPDWEQLDEMVRQWKPAAIIVGMPYNMDGTENDMTEKAESFRKKLQEKYNLPCHGMDERLSTREARNISRENAEASRRKFDERGEVDSLAAQLILESWLEQVN